MLYNDQTARILDQAKQARSHAIGELATKHGVTLLVVATLVLGAIGLVSDGSTNVADASNSRSGAELVCDIE